MPSVVQDLSTISQITLWSIGVFTAAWSIAVLPLWLLFIIIVSAATALTLLRWPWIIWPLLALAIPFTSGLRIGALTATELILAAVIGLWLMDGSRRRSLEMYGSPVALPVLIYIAVLSFSLLWTPRLDDGIAEVVKWSEFALVLALLPVMVNRNHALWLAAALALAGVLQALLGLYQFVFQVGPEWFILYDRFMRASGSFRQPNPYAGYLGVLLPVSFSLAIWAWFDLLPRTGRKKALLWATYFGGATVLIAGGLLASWSRGGWLAAIAALIVVIAVRSRTGLLISLSGCLLMATGSLLGLWSKTLAPASLTARLRDGFALLDGGIVNQPVTDDNFALIERAAHWIAGYRMWESAPWLGIGAGNYASVYDKFRLPLWTEPLGHAHNWYLNVLAETGLIGLAAFSLMWISLAVWAFRRRYHASAPTYCGWCRAMSAAVIGSMVYVTVHSLVDVLFVQGIYLTLGLVIAVLAAGCGSNSRIAAPSSKEFKI